MDLGTLADDLGCFPLDHESHHPQSDWRGPTYGIRSLIEVGKSLTPALIQCSTSTS